jgi:HAD superfamily hydrolase (TIGR01450 family)
VTGNGRKARASGGYTTQSVPPLPTITIDLLLDRYEALLFDAYGVLVHGSGPLPGAGELVTRLNREGRRYFVVTNDASKQPSTAAHRFQRFGLPIDASRILTSGMLLVGHFATHGLIGRRCAVLGPRDSAHYVEEAGGLVVSPDEPFEVLVIGDESGFPFLDWADAALSSLFASIDAGRDVHLVVPNPDLIYPGGNGFGFAAGTIANMFEGALALRYPARADLRFVRLGKPNAPIFEDALRRAGTARVVMIGDQLETDIKGARAAGLDAVWIETGVTSAIPEDTPAHLRPTWRMADLVSTINHPGMVGEIHPTIPG